MIFDFYTYLLEQAILGSGLFIGLWLLDKYLEQKAPGKYGAFVWLNFFVFLTFPLKKLFSSFYSAPMGKVYIVESAPMGLVGIDNQPVVQAGFATHEIALGIWLFGFILCLAYFVIVPLVASLKFSRSYKQSSDVVFTEQSKAPFVAGLLSPKIYLPINLEQFFTQKEIQGVILHEKAHIKNGDLYKLMFARVVSSLFWFLPFCYVALGRLIEAMEFQADEQALKVGPQFSKREFAEILLKMQNFEQSQKNVSLSLGIFNKTQLHRRIDMISKMDIEKSRNRILFLIIFAALVMGSFFSINFQAKANPNGFVTVLMKIYDEENNRVASPSLISIFGEEMYVQVNDSEGEPQVGIRVKAGRSEKSVILAGTLCINPEKMDPVSGDSKAVCGARSKFKFRSEFGKVANYKDPKYYYRIEARVLEGVQTQSFLENSGKPGSGGWKAGVDTTLKVETLDNSLNINGDSNQILKRQFRIRDKGKRSNNSNPWAAGVDDPQEFN